MSKMNLNHVKTTFCACGLIVLFTIGAQASMLSPDPNNAALLYYQAFLLQPVPDEATFFLLEDVTKGAEPNQSVKTYLNRPFSRATIELAQDATRIRLCDWGPLYPGGYGHNTLLPSLQRLSTFMRVYARSLAAEGHFRSALENCIAIQRMADHIGDKTFMMFSTSRMVNGEALTCIKHILGSMPADVETLIWLKGRLVPSNVSPGQMVEILKSNCNLHLQYMRDHPKAYPAWWKEFPRASEDPNFREEILERASTLYDKLLESTLKILESGLHYESKKAELRKLITRIENQIENENDDSKYYLILGDCVPYVESCYDLMVRDVANFSTLTVALEVYLVKARTGHVPETLPANQTRDPYSDRDFEYKVIDEGFALRWRDDDGQKGKSRWIEFKVKK